MSASCGDVTMLVLLIMSPLSTDECDDIDYKKKTKLNYTDKAAMKLFLEIFSNGYAEIKTEYSPK